MQDQICKIVSSLNIKRPIFPLVCRIIKSVEFAGQTGGEHSQSSTKPLEVVLMEKNRGTHIQYICTYSSDMY